MSKYVKQETSPRFICVDARMPWHSNEPRTTAEAVYNELALQIMWERGTDAWPLDTDKQMHRFDLVQKRLTRWLAWKDRLEARAEAVYTPYLTDPNRPGYGYLDDKTLDPESRHAIARARCK